MACILRKDGKSIREIDGILNRRYSTVHPEQFKFIRGVMLHEIGHSEFDHWPKAKQEAWIKEIEKLGPLSDYNSSFTVQKIQNARSRALKLKKLADTDYEKYKNNVFTSFGKTKLNKKYKAWGADILDFHSGKFKEISDMLFRTEFYRYENEQFAEFKKAASGEPNEWGNNNPETLKAMKKIYDKLNKEFGDQLSALLALYAVKSRLGDKPISQLTASEKKMVSSLIGVLKAWDSSKHPRGQPNNPGQFAEVQGGGKPDKKESKLKSAKITTADFKQSEKITLDSKTEHAVVIKNTWNALTDKERGYVEKLNVFHDDNLMIYGEFKYGQGVIGINIRSGTDPEHYAGILRHELTHAIYSTWPIELQNEWIKDMNRMSSIVEVNDGYRQGDIRDKYELNANQVKRASEWLIKDVANGMDMKESESYEMMKEHLTDWGITTEDVKSGKFKDMADHYYNQIFYAYADEQLCEFMRAYHGHGVKPYTLNEVTYNRMKKLYEEKYAHRSNMGLVKSDKNASLSASSKDTASEEAIERLQAYYNALFKKYEGTNTVPVINKVF